MSRRPTVPLLTALLLTGCPQGPGTLSDTPLPGTAAVTDTDTDTDPPAPQMRRLPKPERD